jgi:signal transduction histidine kinase
MKIQKIVLLLIILTYADSFASIKEPSAVKGIIDLRETSENSYVLRLQGKWEFYWNKLLTPGDFSLNKQLKPDYYGQVPSYWTDYDADSIVTSRMGYATYRLLVLLPSGFRKSMAFDMPVFDSSYDIYVNGKLMASNGKTGKNARDSEPWYERNFFRFDPSSDTISIIVNVSNYDHRRGGFWLPMKIGTFQDVQRQYSMRWALDWITVSLLFGFSLLFLFFFIIYPKDKLIGVFSLATIGLALRPLFTSNFLIHNLADLKWIWIVRFEYLGLYLVLTGWYWFFSLLYPDKYFRIITKIITIIFVTALVLTLFLPVKLFSYMTFVIYPLLILLIVYTLFQCIRGMINRNRIDYVYFISFLILSWAAFHDVRISLGKPTVTSFYVMTHALVVFVFIQAVLILYKWIKSYSEKEKLQKELEDLNRNLEKKVKERTKEINARKEEIENQSARIALQNKELSETIQLKNKIFSVIAHDLRSPVVNILYMLNLLKDEEYKEKYDTFADTSIQYAQQVISLLENMLVWGRGQEDKIKFSPERRDLADIILTNMSIFKDTADKKEISVNFTQIGNSKAFFDKDLLDIIIRNLLSNAVKYTERGGRISILLKDRRTTGEGIILKVCDNGVGIPESKQKYLFTSAEIESTPGTENEKGTGFGLKLCNELIKINEGTISVQSKEGEGTCFSITLPV